MRTTGSLRVVWCLSSTAIHLIPERVMASRAWLACGPFSPSWLLQSDIETRVCYCRVLEVMTAVFLVSIMSVICVALLSP